MLRAIARKRRLFASALVVVLSAYALVLAVLGASAARTVGVGYCAVMVTIGVLLFICDAVEKEPRKRRARR
jgi:hypothetical protein